MHPAPSIIFFTVFSGLGFGMLAFLGLGFPDASGFTAFAFFTIAYILAVGGLVSSLFHLGHPERAIKAFSQWRSSWLSREGVLAVAALATMGIYAIAVIFFHTRIVWLGALGALFSVATIFATSMIYTQMKTVPRWNHFTTPILFLGYGLSGGAYLTGEIKIGITGMVLTGLIQIVAWIMGDKLFAQSGSTIETATGLGAIGKTRMFEAPHTGENYLMKEMVHQIGRKHAVKLRVIGAALLFVVPYLILEILNISHMTMILALLVHLAGLLTIRWLFFAEAEHTVGLYYGQQSLR